MTAVDPISLGGWHTAYALRYGDVNAAIAAGIKSGKSPLSATLKADNAVPKIPANGETPEQPARPATVAVTGRPQPWGLSAGGVGKVVVLALDVLGVTVEFKDAAGATTSTTTINAVHVKIDALLQTGADGTIKVVRPAGPDSPYTLDISGATPGLRAVDSIRVKGVFTKWLDTLWGEFGQALTRIEITGTKPATGTDPWAWLRPTFSTAIVRQLPGAAVEDQQLVILSMTGPNPRPPTGEVISGDLIPQDAHVGFVIAPQLVLENLIKPGVKAVIKSAEPAHFKTSGRKLASAVVYDEPEFKMGDADAVAATISKVQYELSGEEIKVTLSLAFPYGALGAHNVDVELDFECRMQLGLSRVDVKLSDGSTAKGVPIVKATNTFVGSNNITVTTVPALDYSSWLVPLGLALLAGIAAGVDTYNGARTPPDVAGENPSGNFVDVQLQDLGGGPDPEGYNSISEGEDDVAQNVAEQPRSSPRKFGAIPSATAKALGSGIVAFLVGGVIGTIPFWISIGQSRAAESLATTLDDALREALQPVSLPVGLDQKLELSSIGLNDALVIGAALKS